MSARRTQIVRRRGEHDDPWIGVDIPAESAFAYAPERASR
jgi:hypothetical protein